MPAEVQSFAVTRAEEVFSESPFRAFVARKLSAGLLHLAGDRVRIAAAHAIVDGQGPAQWVRVSTTAGGGDALIFRFPFRLTRNAGDVLVYVQGYSFRAQGDSNRATLLARMGRYTSDTPNADVVTGTVDFGEFVGRQDQPWSEDDEVVPRGAVAYPRGVGFGRWEGPIRIAPVRTTSLDQMVEVYLDDATAASFTASAVLVFEAHVRSR